LCILFGWTSSSPCSFKKNSCQTPIQSSFSSILPRKLLNSYCEQICYVLVNKWITHVLKVSNKRMWFFNSLKRITYLLGESLDYIKRYQIITDLIKVVKKRENNRFVLRDKNKTKAMLQIISKEIGNSNIMIMKLI